MKKAAAASKAVSFMALDDAELKVQEAHAKVVTGEYALKNMSAMAQR